MKNVNDDRWIDVAPSDLAFCLWWINCLACSGTSSSELNQENNLMPSCGLLCFTCSWLLERFPLAFPLYLLSQVVQMPKMFPIPNSSHYVFEWLKTCGSVYGISKKMTLYWLLHVCFCSRALSHTPVSLHINQTHHCKLLPGLVSSQAQLCRSNLELMQTIIAAAREVKKTCQKTFADMRWNCSSIDIPSDSSKYRPDLDRGRPTY